MAAGCSLICVLDPQEGYDHSYFFMSTFIDEHIALHAKFLKGD